MNIIDIKTIFKDKKKLQDLGLGIGVGLLIIFLYSFFFLRPQIISLKKYRSTASSLKRDVADATNLVNNIENLKLEQERLVEKIGLIEKKIPGEKETALLLEYISDMARQSKVEIVGLEPAKTYTGGELPPQDSQEQQDSPFSEAIVFIRARCGYHQLGTFINKIENSTIMRVKEFKIESSAKDTYSHSVKLLVGMVTLKEGISPVEK